MSYIELVVKIDDQTYNNFVRNEYSRADVIAMHAALVNATPNETVTEFADRCRECGAKYGKLLKDVEEIREVMSCDDADAETKCKMISNILTAKPHYFEKQKSTDTWSIKDVADALTRHGLIVEQESEIGRWVPVSERPPEEGKTVIASTEYGVYPETRFTKEYGWEWAYEAGADYWRPLAYVQAWMPLPEPYEPQEEEDGE